jgi:hypothetical protein
MQGLEGLEELLGFSDGNAPRVLPQAEPVGRGWMLGARLCKRRQDSLLELVVGFDAVVPPAKLCFAQRTHPAHFAPLLDAVGAEPVHAPLQHRFPCFLYIPEANRAHGVVRRRCALLLLTSLNPKP